MKVKKHKLEADFWKNQLVTQNFEKQFGQFVSAQNPRQQEDSFGNTYT